MELVGWLGGVDLFFCFFLTLLYFTLLYFYLYLYFTFFLSLLLGFFVLFVLFLFTCLFCFFGANYLDLDLSSSVENSLGVATTPKLDWLTDPRRSRAVVSRDLEEKESSLARYILRKTGGLDQDLRDSCFAGALGSLSFWRHTLSMLFVEATLGQEGGKAQVSETGNNCRSHRGLTENIYLPTRS